MPNSISNNRTFILLLDRIGTPSGSRLIIEQNEQPATFEERSLPVTQLNDPYYQYQLTEHLPDGWIIRTSTLAPAFGRTGGAKQSFFLDQTGAYQPVRVLLKLGVLIPL
jgi:hypothetical protein